MDAIEAPVAVSVGFGGRQLDGESGALADKTADGDGAAVVVDDGLGDGEAETGVAW